jgi:hypothetical protein
MNYFYVTDSGSVYVLLRDQGGGLSYPQPSSYQPQYYLEIGFVPLPLAVVEREGWPQ